MGKLIKFLSKKKVKNFITLNIGIFLVSLSYTCFLNPNNIVAGGVGGIATVVTKTFLTTISPSVIILVLDVFFLILGLIFLGKEFFKKTAYGSLVYPLFTFLCELIYNNFLGSFTLSEDLLLCVLCSSCITGFGLGLSIKSGGSTGGFDVLQLMMNKYLHFSMTFALIITDGIVVLLSGIFLTSFKFILYGVLFIFVSGKFIEAVTLGGLNSQAVYFLSKKNDEIKKIIIDELERTVTEIYSRGGFHGEDKMMLLCIMSTREYNRIISKIEQIDPKVFIFVSSAKEVRGEGFSFDTFHE